MPTAAAMALTLISFPLIFTLSVRKFRINAARTNQTTATPAAMAATPPIRNWSSESFCTDCIMALR